MVQDVSGSNSPEPGDEANGDDDLTLLIRWIADQPDPPRVALTCAHEPGRARTASGVFAVRLAGCAGELSLASYLEVAASGVTQLTVVTSGCPRAERSGATIDAANDILQTYPKVPLVARDQAQLGRRRRGQGYDIARLPLSRRRLLFLGRLDHRWMPDVHAGQRLRVLAALRQLANGAAPPLAMHTLSAPCAALVARECTACGVCVRSCPNGALRLDRPESETGPFRLVSSLALCEDCGRCTSFCPEGVLLRTGAVDWARLIDDASQTVATGYVRRCEHCGASFARSETSKYCPPCQFRMENPFGSRPPLGSAATTSFSSATPQDLVSATSS
jgi:ferredoxin